MSVTRPSGAFASFFASFLLTFAAGVSAGTVPVATESLELPDAPLAAPADAADSGYWFVQLREAPAAIAFREATGGRGRPTAAERERAREATRTRVADIARSQARVERELNRRVPAARVLYRTSKASNGLVVAMDAEGAAAMRSVDGVRAVLPLHPETPTLSSSVPFLESEAVWDAAGFGSTGEGISIGIIDTGVDYQHPTFGGTGLLADYQANDRTLITDGGPPAFFPTAAVVGGFDFAGDAYNGNNAAAPDPDPMDCNGHGTHVASTAAGRGVNTDGTPYTGPWDASTNFAGLRIGPGTAPGAQVYALRVFGCTGSTLLTALAIEWAMDPNDDDDLSDHLDVINMSLGSATGTLNNASVIASQNAAEAGVIVVASAGNSGETFGIGGAPGVATRAISVANIADSGLAGASLLVNAPAGIAGGRIAANNAFSANVPPPPAGQTADVVPVQAASGTAIEGCTGPLANAGDIAGGIALVRRGGCNFNVKIELAQAAGAIGVIVFDNAVGEVAPNVMGGSGSIPITIPAISTTNTVGTEILNTILGGDPVNVTLNLVPATDTINASSSRGPRIEDYAPKPDVAAPGTSITAAQTGVTGPATYAPDGQALILSGTSMAAPHIAGIAALLRALHPDHTVEQIKAMIVNGALDDVYLGAGNVGGRIATSRAGSGRASALNSAALPVIALNDDGSGAVSIGFDDEIVGNSVQSRRLRLYNQGDTAVTVDLAFDLILDTPGVAFGLPDGDQVVVPAGDSVTVDVTLTADAQAMRHFRDPALAAVQAAPAPLTALGARARHYLNEESAVLTLSNGGTPFARLPVYVAARPASTLSASPTVVDTGSQPTGTQAMTLSGTGLCSGDTSTPGTCGLTLPDPTAVASMVSPFELQYLSPRDPALVDRNDVSLVGVNFQGGALHFAIGTWGWRGSPNIGQFAIEIDDNADGAVDKYFFTGDMGTVARLYGGSAANAQDVQGAWSANPPSGGGLAFRDLQVNPGVIDSRLYGNDVVVLSATPASIGVTGTAFRYRVRSCLGFTPLCPLVGGTQDPATPWLSYDTANPGVSFDIPPFTFAMPDGTFDLSWNVPRLIATGSLGALLVFHHNARGTTQQVIPFANTDDGAGNPASEAHADVAASLGVDDPNPTVGSTVLITAGVLHEGGTTDPVTVNAVLTLPEGLTYVSDNGGGAFAPTTGAWTVGALANGGQASLEVVASVDRAGPQSVSLQAVGDVVDTQLDDNTVEVDFAGVRSSDLTVAVSADATSVTTDDTVTFTVALSNAGPSEAVSIDVSTDFGGAAHSLVGTTPSVGAYDAGSGAWTLPSLAAGATATLAVAVQLEDVGTTTFTANAVIDDDDPTLPNTDSVDVTVAPGAPNEIVVVAGSGQSAAIGTAFATAFAVEVRDAVDNPIPGTNVTFAAPGAGASGTFAASATVPTNGSGVAAAPTFTANATVGSYAVTATAGTVSADLTLTNTAGATTTTLLAAAPTVLVDDAVLMTATVAAVVAGNGVPTGTVDFAEGVTVVCDDVALDGAGQATCSYTPTLPGTRSLTATYAGSTQFLTSAGNGSVDALRDSTAVTVAAQPASVFVGDTVTLTATVVDGSGDPVTEGAIDFRAGATPLCQAVALDAQGEAVCSSAVAAAAGDYTVTAEFAQTDSHAADDGTASVTLVREATTVALLATPNPVAAGATVTLEATVSASVAVAAGTVDFRRGATVLCDDVPVNGAGVATCATAFAASGTATVEAEYGGSARFLGAVSGTVDVDVTASAALADFTVAVSPDPVLPGGTVTLTANLSGNSGVPTGTVTFLVDGVLACVDVTVDAGVASCTTTVAGVGEADLDVEAQYSGDAVYTAASGTAVVRRRTDSLFIDGFEG